MSKSEFLKVNLQAISKRAFASALEKAKNESQTKSKSENDESQVLIEFNNEHPGFAHTTVTKKLLPILISRLMTKMYEKISQEKVVKMLDTEPYKSAGVDKIFRDDNLRLQLEKDCELNEDDQKEAVIRAREKTKSKKWTDKLINLADILSDPDKFYVAFFKDEPPLLRKMAKREIKEESDISMAMSKYKDSKILTFKLLITTLRDYDYDKLDLFMKIKFKFAAKLTNWGMNHAGLQIGPYIIDWNDSSLILPRYLSSKHAKALIPINDKVTPTKDQACPTICRLICQWNREFTYENCISFKPETKKGNCQHFVQQILDALGIKNNWKPWGPVDKYISKIAEGTMGKDIIISDPDAQEIFINSHEELRQFYKNIMENPKVKGDRVLMDEYLALLKSVERSFQLRHMGNPEVFPEIKDPIFGDFTGKLSAK